MRRTYVETLKKAVEEKFSRKILTSAECNELANDIYKRTGLKLNANTLRRVYGLVKSPYLPSHSTVNTLSMYCGYKGLDDFINNRKDAAPAPVDDTLYQYIEMLFHQLEVDDVNDPTYIALVRNTIAFLKKKPQMIEPFQKLVAKTSNGQKFYYEHLVNLDELASFYGDGLLYYLDEKATKEAQIFGHALLCFKGWMTLDHAAFLKHYQEVVKYTIDPKVHPFVCGRYFGVRLLHAEMEGAAKGGIMAEARHFYEELKGRKLSFPRFELILADILIQVREYEEALFYIDHALKKKKEHLPQHVDKSLLLSFRLYKAIALLQTGKEREARVMLEGLIPSDFYFLSQKYYSILYLRLKYHFQQRRSILEQINHLIEETGFKRFYYALSTVVSQVVPVLSC